jgi:predicted RNA-binding protein YlqC (UPF0109 family)
MNQIVETVEYILKSILPAEANVSVGTRQDNEMMVIEISAAPEFVGQIIGKEGKIIKSIRTLLNLSFPEVRYLLEIKE